MKQTPGLNNLTGKPEKSMYTHIYSTFIVQICVSRRTCVTKRFGGKHMVSCPRSWTVTVRSNRSCWLCLIQICCFFLQLYAKLSTFTPSGFPLTCVQLVTLCVCVCECVNMDVVIVDVTLRLMSARVHPSRREKLPEQSSLNTLLQEASHLSHAVFQVPNRTSSCQTHVSADLQQPVFTTYFLKGLLFNEEQVTFEWHVSL